MSTIHRGSRSGGMRGHGTGRAARTHCPAMRAPAPQVAPGLSGRRVIGVRSLARVLGLGLAIAAGIASAATAVPAPLPLVPAPASLHLGHGAFRLDEGTRVWAQGENAGAVARYFIDHLARASGVRVPFARGDVAPPGAIVFALDPALPDAGAEAYRLSVRPGGVRVSARDAHGLFYGAITLWQLASQWKGPALELPALHVEDRPRLPWRGVMLDSARHYQSVQEIKALLDAMALHKLNTFHWHLTDDQGWRIEIRRYPRLTDVGGCRVAAGDAGVDATGRLRPYCRWYTQAQIREVVQYAAERHITVVPEIDVPGHATAAIAAYPALGVLDAPLQVSNQWGVHANLFNVEAPTLAFLENVLAEVMALFPGRYLHVGGDEAVKDQWENSPAVQARMRALGVTSEAQLQSHVIKRLQAFLAAHDRRLIGWDEILEGDLPPDATVMSWRGIEGGIAAARLGHDVVMSPSSDLYLDRLQTDAADEPPGRPLVLDLRQVYAFDPVPAQLEPRQRAHILGLQANLWTEHIRSFARVQHALFPRIAAVAESGWSPASIKDYDGFVQRLPGLLSQYRAWGIDYAQTPFQVQYAFDAAGRVALRNPLGYADIRYTLDGSTPPADSRRYVQPLAPTLPAMLRAAVFVDGQPLAAATSKVVDAAALRRRRDEDLAMCTGQLMLRLEDDGPADRERAIFNVDIFNPCWQWNQADLRQATALQVRAGRLPYNFQLAHDEPHRRFQPAASAQGDLVVRDGCQGRILASVPLPAQPGRDGFVTLSAPLAHGAEATSDLCVYFTGDTRPTMWVVDQLTLEP